MWESLRPFFDWCFSTYVGTAIRESTWAFAYIEVFHLFGLTVLLGSAFIVSLRMAGLTLRTQSVKEVAHETDPFMMASLGLVLVSGILLFLSEALKCFNSPPFEAKMIFLFLAILFQFTMVRKLSHADEGRYSSILNKAVAGIAVLLWLGVGVAGRAIGFF